MEKKMLLVGLSCVLAVNSGGCQGGNPRPEEKAMGIFAISLSEEVKPILDSTLLVDAGAELVREEGDGKKDSGDNVESGAKGVTVADGSKIPKESRDDEPGDAKKTAKQQKSDASPSQDNTAQGNTSQGNIPQDNVPQAQEPVIENNWQPEPEPVVEVVPNATAADSEQVAQKVLGYINSYRSSPATSLSGLGGYARYRSRQLVSNFSHDTNAERAAATALCYGEYVDPSVYGMTGDPYYTACAREAIAKGGYEGTVDEVAESLAQLIKNSSGHWNYVGSSDYPYIAVGVTYEGGIWYCDVAVAMENTDNK